MTRTGTSRRRPVADDGIHVSKLSARRAPSSGRFRRPGRRPSAASRARTCVQPARRGGCGGGVGAAETARPASPHRKSSVAARGGGPAHDRARARAWGGRPPVRDRRWNTGRSALEDHAVTHTSTTAAGATDANAPQRGRSPPRSRTARRTRPSSTIKRPTKRTSEISLLWAVGVGEVCAHDLEVPLTRQDFGPCASSEETTSSAAR